MSTLSARKLNRYNRRTKSLFSLYDGLAANMDTTGGRWQVVCEKHGTILSVTTRKQAEKDLAQPESFCEHCRAKVEAAPKKPPKSDIYIGEDAYQVARHKARYGHKDWFAWLGKDGQRYAARANAETCKMAMLASGTQGKFTRYSSDGWGTSNIDWRDAVLWWSHLKRGWM